MVHKTSIIPGLSRFIDESILVHYPPTSMKRILMASGISLYLKGNEGMIDSLISNPLFGALGVTSDDGMIDLERLRDTLKSEISKAGYMRMSFPVVGDIDFTPDDVDALYNYICQQEKELHQPKVIPVSNLPTHTGGVY